MPFSKQLYTKRFGFDTSDAVVALPKDRRNSPTTHAGHGTRYRWSQVERIASSALGKKKPGHGQARGGECCDGSGGGRA